MNNNKLDKIQKPKKKIGLYIFFAAVTIFFLSLILSFQDIGEIFKAIIKADPINLMWAVVLLLIYVGLYPVTTCILVKSQKLPISQPRTYAIGMTEHFFNGITPFATGGQPFQVYAFAQNKVRPEDSTGVLLMNFIIHMIVTNVFALCSLFYFPRFAGDNLIMYIIAVVGFTINFAVLFFIIALATSKKLSNVIMKILKKLSNISWLNKFLSPKIPRIQDYCDNTQAAFKHLIKNKFVFLQCFIVRLITMFVYYSITFFILRALHVEIGFQDFFFVACGSCFAITMVVFLPTPGSSGGIEFAFENILASITMSSSVISYGGMLLWRLLSYYLLMIVSLIFYIVLSAVQNKEMRKENQINNILADNTVSLEQKDCTENKDNIDNTSV